MAIQIPAYLADNVVDTFDEDLPLVLVAVETYTDQHIMEEAHMLQQSFNTRGFSKPLEPVETALFPRLGEFTARRSFGARNQRSLYVKRAGFNALTIGAHAPAHPQYRVNSNIEMPFWDAPRLAGIGYNENHSLRIREALVLDHANSAAPTVAYMHQEHEKTISSLYKKLGVPTFLYARDNSVMASSNYYKTLVSVPLPVNGGGAFPPLPAVHPQPGLLAITRDIHAQTQNVYACKDLPTTFQDHAIAAIFRTQTRTDNRQPPHYEWILFGPDNGANRALTVAQNAIDGYQIGGVATIAANSVIPVTSALTLLQHRVRPRQLVLQEVSIAEMANLVLLHTGSADATMPPPGISLRQNSFVSSFIYYRKFRCEGLKLTHRTQVWLRYDESDSCSPSSASQ
uniref:Uncharacterized protein n=1 Tax=viral metagenome TaxID=1070528 RepID=A0A2V0RI17_9ZZZZ